MLECSHFKHLQYNRCESIEITGISDNVDDKHLGNACHRFKKP